jgi:hypothetical protein
MMWFYEVEPRFQLAATPGARATLADFHIWGCQNLAGIGDWDSNRQMAMTEGKVTIFLKGQVWIKIGLARFPSYICISETYQEIVKQGRRKEKLLLVNCVKLSALDLSKVFLTLAYPIVWPVAFVRGPWKYDAPWFLLPQVPRHTSLPIFPLSSFLHCCLLINYNGVSYSNIPTLVGCHDASLTACVLC